MVVRSGHPKCKKTLLLGPVGTTFKKGSYSSLSLHHPTSFFAGPSDAVHRTTCSSFSSHWIPQAAQCRARGDPSRGPCLERISELDETTQGKRITIRDEWWCMSWAHLGSSLRCWGVTDSHRMSQEFLCTLHRCSQESAAKSIVA